MQKAFFLLFTLSSVLLGAQTSYQSLDTIKAPSPAAYKDGNIYVRPLYKDSAEVSSFIIFIKKEVKMHKHAGHAEHVLVLDGTGQMILGEKTFTVKKGDMIFIPKNTFHAVRTTSRTPLKVISVQAPFFDGKDRIMKE